jgi:hypothetical protein
MCGGRVRRARRSDRRASGIGPWTSILAAIPGRSARCERRDERVRHATALSLSLARLDSTSPCSSQRDVGLTHISTFLC